MTTVKISLNLPDELAQPAMSQRGPQEERTPEIEQEIVEEVRKARAQRRFHGAS